MNKKKGRPTVNWGHEVANSASLGGRIFFRVLGYLFNILLTLLLIGIISGTIIGGAFVLYVTNYVDSSIDGIELITAKKNMTTKICYVDYTDRANGVGEIKEITDQRLYGSENRVWVSYNGDGVDEEGEIPQALVDAFVCVEDHRFWQHNGVDWITTTKKAFNYFTGQMDGGASTITQQTIKNLTGDNDVTIQRKAQEILRALNLEKSLGKEQILELYLNNIYLSRGCYGVGAAAHTYFGKDVSELTLLECATLAGITQNPSKYDPVSRPENCKERRNTVLLTMYYYEKITKDEYYELISQDLVLNYNKSGSGSTSNGINTWYTDAAIEEAIELIMDHYDVSYLVAESLVYTSGFQIVTAQDYEIQQALEEYYANDDNFPSVDESFIQPQSSCVIIDPDTGDVLALAGARGEKLGNRILNYATQTKRPPGSSIKPISVYAPALEAGLITYGTIVDDVPVNFGEQFNADTGELEYTRTGGYPSNAPNVYNGLTTIHSAVRRSVNTVAWRVLEELTLEISYSFLRDRLGITSLVYADELASGAVVSDLGYAPLALGQLSYGITVKEITAAYSIFANNGIYNKERIVLKILDNEGNVIINNDMESDIVISEQNACIMTKMLKEVVDSGTASRLTVKNKVNIAGKTGTTQSDNDRWFVGYSPYYICGVWFGYSMPKSLGSFSSSKSPALVVWDDVMNIVHDKKIAEENAAGRPIEKFETAPGVITATYCMDSGKLMTDACKSDPRGSRAEIGYFVQGTEPTESCDVHVLVNYDSVTKGIANDGCPAENIKQVGLIKVNRNFPIQITVTDAQYVYMPLPLGVIAGGTTEDPYFVNALPEGTYTGKSSGTVQYNHVCQEHSPNDIVDDNPLDDDPFDIWDTEDTESSEDTGNSFD